MVTVINAASQQVNLNLSTNLVPAAYNHVKVIPVSIYVVTQSVVS